MVDLAKLSPAALSAAMRGGTREWGMHGSDKMIRYAEPQNHPASVRKLCRCGCRTRIKWRGMANGVCLIEGCELKVRRWVRSNPGDGRE